MKSRTIFYGIGLVLLLFLNSCATLMETNSTTTMINSEPQGAIVVEDEYEIGTTPFRYTVTDPESHKGKLVLKKEGYADLPITIPIEELNGYLAMDALMLCIPCIIDLNKGATYRIPNKEYSYVLTRPIPEHETPISLIVSPITTTLPNKMAVGRVNSSSIYFSRTELMSHLGRFTSYSQKISDALNDYYFKSRYITPGTENNNSGIKAKIRLEPELVAVDAQLKETSGKSATGTGMLEMKMTFYNAYTDSLLYSDNIRIDVTKRDSYYYLIDQMIDALVLQLITTDNLYTVLTEGARGGMDSPVGAEIELVKLSYPDAKDKKELFNRLVKGTVTIKTNRGFGSGVVVSSDGYIITNQHVIEDATKYDIEFSEGLSLGAELIKENEMYDLAILKVNATGLKALSFGDSEQLSLGEEVYAIGTGGDTQLGQSVSKGIVSGFRVLDDIPYIQTDVSINPGNSGGPLVNEKGELVGIATMKLMGDGVEGIGFCIPSNKLVEILNIKLN